MNEETRRLVCYQALDSAGSSWSAALQMGMGGDGALMEGCKPYLANNAAEPSGIGGFRESFYFFCNCIVAQQFKGALKAATNHYALHTKACLLLICVTGLFIGAAKENFIAF